jgi:hypothetical protein
MKHSRILAIVPLGLLLLALAPLPPRPMIPHAGLGDVWSALYPESPSAEKLANTPLGTCSLCHKTSHTWNGYGWQMLLALDEGLSPAEALLSLEKRNSDGDPSGASSLAEIQAGTQPGWTPGPNNTIYYREGILFANQEPPDDVPDGLDPACAVLSSTTFRNGSGVNPECLASLTSPVLGSEWRIQVDASGVPGADATLVRSEEHGATGPVHSFGQVLLDLSSPTIFVLAHASSGGLDVHSIQVPTWSALLGFSATMQGAVLVHDTVVQLCNAVDYVVGCHP